jgi:uncharacterized membrane protein
LRIAPKFRLAFEKTRNVLVAAVIVSTLATFLSGYQASGSLGDLKPEVQEELGSHHAWGRILLINSLVMGTFSWLATRATHGRRLVVAIYLVALGIQLALSIAVGFMGGELVFGRGLGIRLN